jgi:hypothetical protein
MEHGTWGMIILLFTALLAGGCRKYLPFEGENKPPRLVLNGQIQADSVFMVDLAHSLGYVDIGQIRGVENGTVDVLLAGGGHLETLTHIGEGRYVGSQVPVPGQSYRVEASAGSYPSIFAVDAVPQVVPIAGWTASVAQTDGDMYTSVVNVSFSINDPGVANFYMIEAFNTRHFDVVFIGVHPVTGIGIYDTIFFDIPQRHAIQLATSDVVLTSSYDAGIGETKIWGDRFLFSDEMFNGSLRQFHLELNHFMGQGQMELQLTSLSAGLFRYFRTYERYLNTQGDPFSEPVQVFNNIQGGLGIWGGRSSFNVIIEP